MKGGFAAVAVLTCLLASGVPRAAHAQGRFETLVMPGPLTRAHAAYESQCGSCHERLSETTQSRLCQDCHQEVAGDIAARAGFHGRIANAVSAECRSCHTEHGGRDADIVALDRDTFDHEATDYPLRGAHAAAACATCHLEGRKFRETSETCESCHRDDDVHSGRLGTSCESCHSETVWRDVRFDHDQTTFPLLGEHAAVTCSVCHVNQRFEGLSTDCYACHRLTDAHRGAHGTMCGNCHAETDWKDVSFDHDIDTLFALEGAHETLGCVACHRQDPYVAKVDAACVACHRFDDDHRGRNGEQCAACHTSSAWSDVTFDHERETGFALRNRHADISCAACHRGPTHEVAIEQACVACHRADDPHAGQQGEECGSCHGDAGWMRDVRFDHDITRFPLLGFHLTVPCEECHLTPQFRTASSACSDCHATEDVHAGTLGARCEGCHSPAGWPSWRFDHDAQTDFPLLGAHTGLECGACHTQPAVGAINLSMTCGSCHQQDDAHRGRFGPDCGRCHSSSSFREIHVPL